MIFCRCCLRQGSHNRRALKHQLALLVGHPAKEVLDVYGEQSPVTLTGEAGLGFVEDPSASTWAPCRRARRG